MNQFRQDFNKAVGASIPVFVAAGKWAACVFGAVLWLYLNLLLCESIGAVLTLWAITAVCIIVTIQYHQVVYDRKQNEKMEAYYAKLDVEWQAKYGTPYPR